MAAIKLLDLVYIEDLFYSEIGPDNNMRGFWKILGFQSNNEHPKLNIWVLRRVEFEAGGVKYGEKVNLPEIFFKSNIKKVNFESYT